MSQNTISAVTASNGTQYVIDDVTKSAVSVDNVKADVNMLHIAQADYEQLVVDDEVLSNALYVVSADYTDMYGEQIKNLAPGAELSDAVNYEQLSEVSARAYDTYTKLETDQKIANAQYFKKYVVQTLPSVDDADERGIYLVPSSDPETQNTYDEYVVVGENAQKAWEKIGAKNIDLSGYKTKQTAKTDPTASSTATSFIDTITQNENGEIAATKKTVQSASTSQAGIVQLNSTVTSTSTSLAATASAVKTAYDTAISAQNAADRCALSSRTVAGKALSADVTAADISSAVGLSGYLPTSGGLVRAPNKTTSLWIGDSDQIGYAEFGIEKGDHYAELYSDMSLGIKMYVDDNEFSFPSKDGTFALESDISCKQDKYMLSVAQPVDPAASTLVYMVDDSTITTIEVSSDSTPLSIVLPPARQDGSARDFVLRIEILSSDVPQVSFAGRNGEQLGFESEDLYWAQLSPGVNVVSFTQLKQ